MKIDDFAGNFFNANFFVPAGFEANSGTTESLVLKCGFKLYFVMKTKFRTKAGALMKILHIKVFAEVNFAGKFGLEDFVF